MLSPRGQTIDLKSDARSRRAWVAESFAARRNRSGSLPPQPIEASGYDASAPSTRAVYQFTRRFGLAPEGVTASARPAAGPSSYTTKPIY